MELERVGVGPRTASGSKFEGADSDIASSCTVRGRSQRYDRQQSSERRRKRARTLKWVVMVVVGENMGRRTFGENEQRTPF